MHKHVATVTDGKVVESGVQCLQSYKENINRLKSETS